MMGVDALVRWVLVAALVLAGAQTWRLERERTAHATAVATHAQQMQAYERTAREAEQRAQAETERRVTAAMEVADDTDRKLAQARADAVAAADAGQRLRAQLATLTAACRGGASGHPATAAPGQATDATADLLADVQRRLDEATDVIAGFADQAHAAGLACEHIHEGLTR